MSVDFDRKRPLDEGETSQSKRSDIPLESLSEDGPLTQQDVVYFKKEAIWRQMSYYKTQLRLVTKDLKHFKLNYEANETKLNIVDSWYEQLINLLGLNNNGSVLENDDILVRLTNQSPTSIEYQLLKRRDHLVSLLKPVLENTKLTGVETEDVLNKFEQMNTEFAKLKSEKEALGVLKLDLENRLEALQEELLTLHKEKERHKSASLKRVDESVPEVKEEVKEETPEVKEANGVEQSSEEFNKLKNEYESVTIELEQLRSSNNTLKEQLDDITKKHIGLQQINVELSDRLSNLSEKDLSKSSVYIEVVEHNHKLVNDLNEVNKIKDTLTAKLSTLENEKQDITNLINKEIQAENESLKNQLNKSESDLVRIRTARDELLSKQTILKLELGSKQTNEELVKLNKILSEKVDSLLKEKNSDDSDTSKYESLEKPELIKRIVLLSGEIKEIESVFQETKNISLKKLDQIVDSDGIVKKLTIEKTKADQKYFASMRLKDSLTAENKILKTQISKSQELINKLNDLEKTYLSKIEVLSKSLNEYKMIKESSIGENSKLQELVKVTSMKRTTLENELKTVKNSLADANKVINEHEMTIKENTVNTNKLEAKLRSTEGLLAKYKANNTSSLLQEDEKQLEALRSIAKCSVCSKNWKDTAITVCGHVFCNGCTQERLAARLRRCPSCNKGFSANDLLLIHL